MNIINNALSAKNVRIHGMSSSKWTTKDKIIQYKGLVNLYKRDREITQLDYAVATKRQYKGLINLRKTIENNRHELDNAVRGDRQQLRNILAEHRELQLAYHNLDPQTVIDNLIQINFTKRKVLDKLRYLLQQRCQELKDFKLEESVLQDRLKYEDLDQLRKLEKQSQTITGKVQNALLKKEAALAIQQVYVEIIDVMKKDALYFDGILSAIQTDYWNQCRCVLNATKQGQLATENKNDREQEFDALEKAVIQDMKTQKHDLEKIREQTENVQINLKHLLRRDSDLTTCAIEMDKSKDVEDLHRDVAKIESILTFLRNKTLVASFNLIYPSLQEQVKQKKRLKFFTKKCERNRDIIMNKLNHAELMNSVMDNTMVETTALYRRRKSELLTLIEAEKKKRKDCDVAHTFKQNLIAQVRMSLRQLQQLCKFIRDPGQPVREVEESSLIRSFTNVSEPPPEDEIDGLKIIEELTPKISYLMANADEKMDNSSRDIAYKYYEVLMRENCVDEETAVTAEANALLEGIITETFHVLTRDDIKQQSEAIVAAHSKDDDLIPVMPVKRRRRKFK